MTADLSAPLPSTATPHIQRRYRVRIALFLAGILGALFGLNAAARTINTLRQLDVVEAERNRGQRPDEVLAALDAGEGKVVVDLGLRRRLLRPQTLASGRATGQVFAVDIRHVPLAFLRMRTVLQGLHNVTIVRGAPDDPHLAAGSADAVLVANTFHELDEQSTILSHALRALRSGGRLVVVDPAPDSSQETGAEAHHHEPPERADAALRRAGFEIVARQDRFIEGAHGRWWLIVARRGVRSSR